MPSGLRLWVVVPLLCIWPIAAQATDDDAAKLASECGAGDLPPASVDGCLERVRVLEETDPSAQLQTLEAALEQRESARTGRAQAAVPPARHVVEVAPEPNMRANAEGEPDQASSQPVEPEVSAPVGPTFQDEPPVSDPPDAPAGTGRAGDDDSTDPPRS